MENCVIYFSDFDFEAGLRLRIGVRSGRVCVVARVGVGRSMEGVVRRFGGCVWKERRLEIMEELAEEIAGYLAGRRRRFDVDVELVGSGFERRVWSELCGVRFGECVSYGELAGRCGAPGGARAVGGAVGRNPLLFVVPCHRVVGSDGSLGGFSAGVELKRRLLDMEHGGDRK